MPGINPDSVSLESSKKNTAQLKRVLLQILEQIKPQTLDKV